MRSPDGQSTHSSAGSCVASLEQPLAHHSHCGKQRDERRALHGISPYGGDPRGRPVGFPAGAEAVQRPRSPPLPRQAKSSQELLLASSEDAYIDFGGETHFGAAVL